MIVANEEMRTEALINVADGLRAVNDSVFKFCEQSKELGKCGDMCPIKEECLLSDHSRYDFHIVYKLTLDALEALALQEREDVEPGD